MSKRLLAYATLLTLLAHIAVPINTASADELLERSLTLSNSQSSSTSEYKFGFQFSNSTPLTSISFLICSNSPFIFEACTVPVGMDMTGAVLQSESGNVGFAVSAQTTANRLVLQRNGSAANPVMSTYRIGNIVNPSVETSYFVRVQTFQTTQLTGTEDNYGRIAFAITRNVNISVTVPPYLLFCVGVTVNGVDCTNVVGNYVNFGELSSRQASQGTTQMLAASNAIDGYSIRVSGQTLTSGINTIANLVGSDTSRPGVSQFGMNLRANSAPQGGLDVTGSGSGLPTNGYNQINNYRFNNGDVVALSQGPDRARKFTTTYLVNVNKSQAPGAYVSTLTYIALGSF